MADLPTTVSTDPEESGRICGKCGNKIFADEPEGFCSLCLFKTGLGPLLEEDNEIPKAGSESKSVQFGD